MKTTILLTIAVIGSLLAGLTNTSLADSDAPDQVVRLSPDLLNLLREEMREITAGIQGIPLSLASANWKSIEETGAKLSASYIMAKKLTPAQVHELEQVLPEQFRQLDADFHDRAEKLTEAAAGKDTELVVFHYARLLEGCVRCHSAYASNRFPGFTTQAPQAHHH